MVSSNNFIYSSGDPNLNNTKGGISFKSGDEMIVEVDAKDSKLIVKKKNDSKAVDISLKHISETDWKELYYCVNLGSTGDKVQFLGWKNEMIHLDSKYIKLWDQSNLFGPRIVIGIQCLEKFFNWLWTTLAFFLCFFFRSLSNRFFKNMFIFFRLFDLSGFLTLLFLTFWVTARTLTWLIYGKTV